MAMSKSLVIVESPAKAKTIEKYLGKGFEVLASVGHIMDLPKNDIGVELQNRTFIPTLVVSPGKEKVVAQLKRAAASADEIFLAPDPDREGEAIAYHLALQLGTNAKERKKIRRVTFNEITKKAVQDAFNHARDVDQNLVDAQQTRRVLDRLVGYQISPLLWDKVRRGLSAGRVQTVAVRLIVEREAEINAFQPVEYWTLDAFLHAERQADKSFKARFVSIDGEPVRVANGKDKDGKDQYLSNALPDQKGMQEVLAALEKAKWSLASVQSREQQRRPLAPFITSQLQRDASSKLGFNVRRTMGVAQRLYEGIDIGADGTTGLITYMRTDSPRVSPEAVQGAREWIKKQLGPQYLPASPNDYKGKKDAQDAHEAIRPSDASRTPESIARYLSDEQLKLYTLIWRRFIASQMVPAIFDVTTAKIAAVSEKNGKTYDFRVSGSVVRFDGFLKIYEVAEDKKGDDEDESANKLPNLDNVKTLELEKLADEQHFTSPPPRYNEASLVKVLEEKGIGRPSTYASIINTIQDREYVKKVQAKFVPTEIGTVVTKLLVDNFPYIFDMQYTAKLETELDAVEDGEERWTDLLNGFYDHFEEELAVAGEHMEDIKRKEEPTDQVCDKCGSPLVLKWGKFGSFYSCSNFSRKKPVTVAMGPWKKDSKAVTKKITAALHFPMTVRATVEDNSVFAKEVADTKALVAAIGEAAEDSATKGKKISVEQVSCDFTKENFSAKPDLSAPGADDVPEKEFCDNCGKEMVLKNGQWGPFMSCPDYSADPPCKTIRKLSQKQQQKQNQAQPTGEDCPVCGKPLVLRQGAYGEFVSCSGYPKCKYVKQNLIEGMKCPKCGVGDIAERKARRGNVFWGCTNYPKCDFTSNNKPVPEKCPECGSRPGGSQYLVEKTLKSGIYLECPNKKKGAEEEKPKKDKKAAQPEPGAEIVCHYSKRIGDAPPPPTAETHGPVIEKPEKKELQAV
jgi:DNA topoisomerase I